MGLPDSAYLASKCCLVRSRRKPIFLVSFMKLNRDYFFPKTKEICMEDSNPRGVSLHLTI